MNKNKAKSFAEVTFIEAIARHVHVDMAATEYLPKEENRLSSHFIGIAGQGQIAMTPPLSIQGEKVFLPVECKLVISFSLADMWFRAETKVLEHRMLNQLPTKKVDALIVSQPTELLTANRRRKQRKRLDQDKVFLATLWPSQHDLDEKLKPLHTAKVHDWSEDGLGIMLGNKVKLDIGQKVIIALDGPKGSEHIFLWATLKHSTLCKTDVWLAGFGDLTSVRAGEAVNLMEFISATPE